MEKYNYNFEIRRCILHFMSALDGAVIKRYDKNQKVLDIIKVNYVYGSKERIMRDLIDKAEHTKLPVVSVLMKSISRDASRVRDNIQGAYDDSMFYNESKMVELLPPVPINLSFDVSIITKYQADMEQILSNFIVYSDPYFIVSWREPITGRELRSEILWSGNISLETPAELQAKDQYSKITANTSFEFKGWMFKSNASPVGKICQIDTNYHLTDKQFCDYNHLAEYSDIEDSLTLNGLPKVEWADPIIIKTGRSLFQCSGDWPDDGFIEPETVVDRTESIKITGKFLEVTDVFLSADGDMFMGESLSSIDIFPNNDKFPPFNGIGLKSFPALEEIYEMNLNIPPISGEGFIDVIVVSPCGYSILSKDRKKRQPETDNPYPVGHEMYNSWRNFNDPFKNGIEVIDNSSPCEDDILPLATVNGEILETMEEEIITEVD